MSDNSCLSVETLDRRCLLCVFLCVCVAVYLYFISVVDRDTTLVLLPSDAKLIPYESGNTNQCSVAVATDIKVLNEHLTFGIMHMGTFQGAI